MRRQQPAALTALLGLQSASGLAQRRAVERLDERIGDLRSALARLARTSGGVPTRLRRRDAASEAIARSTGALALEPFATFTTLRSTAEVNTISTSFTPRGPTVPGTTTALPTIGGEYAGDQGDDTLTFEFRDDATVGTSDRLRVRVTDGAGQRIGTLRFRNQPPGTPRALANGLTLSLGPGDVSTNDTFTVQVSASQGSAVDPTKPFDGVRNEDPNFEPGVSVGAGSFDVNGVTVAVNASDSLDDIMARITSSGAGVTASFDAATESVLLARSEPGSGFDVSVGNDTSGFLVATKLAGATSVLGQDGVDPVRQLITDVPALAGVSTGSFSVNGVQLGVDVDVDTLGDVLDRINASGAGATATLDPASLVLSVVSDDPATPVTLADESSGLFTALRIAPGTYARSRGRGARDADRRLVASRQVQPLLRDVRRTLNRVFQPELAAGVPSLDVERARVALRAALVESAFGDAGPDALRVRTGLGVVVDLGAEDGRVLELDSARLERALTRDAGALHDLLFRPGDGSSEPAGLVTGLLATLGAVQDSLDVALGRGDSRGRLVDFRV